MAFTAARAGLGAAITASAAAHDLRLVKLEALRKRARGLIDELDVLLSEDDPG